MPYTHYYPEMGEKKPGDAQIEAPRVRETLRAIPRCGRGIAVKSETKVDEIAAALHLVKAVADAIREAGRLPSGHLYAVMMQHVDLRTYERIIDQLVRIGLVERARGNELVWIGDLKENRADPTQLNEITAECERPGLIKLSIPMPRHGAEDAGCRSRRNPEKTRCIMWLFSRYGFFSVVCAKRGGRMGTVVDRQRVAVRARLKKHLKALLDRFANELGCCKIIEDRQADYRYRIIVLKSSWAWVAQELVKEMNYSNFKNEVKDHDYHEILMDVWRRLHQAQLDEGISRPRRLAPW